MKVLGIDTGLANYGFAVVEFITPTEMRLDRVGEVTTKKSSKKANVLAASDNVRRAREIYRALDPVFAEVGVICMESQSWPRNASAIGKLGLSFCVTAALAERHGLPVIAASPQAIKKASPGANRRRRPP